MTPLRLGFKNISWLDCWNKVSFKYVLLLQNFFSNGSFVFIAFFDSPIYFVCFVDFCEYLLMLYNRGIVCLKHDLRRFDGFHLFNIINENGVVFRALKTDLRCVMLDLHVLFIHDPHGYFMRGDTFLPC